VDVGGRVLMTSAVTANAAIVWRAFKQMWLSRRSARACELRIGDHRAAGGGLHRLAGCRPARFHAATPHREPLAARVLLVYRLQDRTSLQSKVTVIGLSAFTAGLDRIRAEFWAEPNNGALHG